MKAVVPDGRWLEACKVEAGANDIIGGGLVLLYRGAHYRLVLFPDEAGRSEWSVWFTLSSDPADQPRWRTEQANHRDQVSGAGSAEEALAFLRGAHPDKKLKVTEVVLMYPHRFQTGPEAFQDLGMIFERHTVRGVGIDITPNPVPALDRD